MHSRSFMHFAVIVVLGIFALFCCIWVRIPMNVRRQGCLSAFGMRFISPLDFTTATAICCRSFSFFK